MLTFSHKQKWAIGAATRRVNLWEGSIRSGKTYSSLFAFLAAVASPPKGGQIVVCGKNTDSIYRNVFAPIWAEPSLAAIGSAISYRQGSNTAKIFGRTVHIIGANDKRAEHRLRGITAAVVYVDEVTVLPVEFFKQLLGRMSPPGAQLFGTTNPDSPNHWLKRDYLDRLDQLPSWIRFHFTLDDNPALSEEYKADIKAEYTGLWYRRFILGEWVSAEGAIYDMWDSDVHIVPWEQLPPIEYLHGVGMDYGTTNATAAILLGQAADGTLYAIDELRIDSTETTRYTDGQLSEKLAHWLKTPHLPDREQHQPTEPRFICLDPAAASFRAQLFHDGLRNIQAADNRVNDGIALVSTLLANGQLKISDSCQALITEIPGYSWDPKATEKGQDKPIKIADHSLDALRYAVKTLEPLWRPHLKNLRGRVNDNV